MSANCRDEQCRSYGRCMAAPLPCCAELPAAPPSPEDYAKAYAILRHYHVPEVEADHAAFDILKALR